MRPIFVLHLKNVGVSLFHILLPLDNTQQSNEKTLQSNEIPILIIFIWVEVWTVDTD